MAEQGREEIWTDLRIGASDSEPQSIVQWANAVWQKGAHRSGGKAPEPPEREPDGYLRQTPVQPVCACPGYRAKIARKAVFWILVAAAAVTAYYLIAFGVIRL